MKLKALFALIFLTIVISNCGMFPGDETVEIMLDEYKISVEYEPATMGDTDRVSIVYPGRKLKLGGEKPAVFTTESNLTSGAGVVFEGTFSIWLHRGLKDNWYLLYSRDVEGTEYNKNLDQSVLPLKYGTDPTPVDELSITLNKSDEEAAFAISWGIHRFETMFALPPVKN